MRRGTRRGGAGTPPAGDGDAADRRRLGRLERAFEAVRARAGDELACRPGCDACCHGPFPITRLDRRRLERGIAALAERDPRRAAAIRARARETIVALSDGFPGDRSTGRPCDDVERLDGFFAAHAALPCPVLDPASGRCELYDARPVACRLHGPPVRFPGGDVPPCDLCFRDASDETIERCRLRVDVPADDDRSWDTLIAWAVARSDA